MLVNKRLLSLCSKKLPGKLNFLLRNSSFIPIEHSYYQYFVSAVLSFAFPCAKLLPISSTSVASSTNCSHWRRQNKSCLLYTSDAADDLLCVDLGGRRIIKKKKNKKKN